MSYSNQLGTGQAGSERPTPSIQALAGAAIRDANSIRERLDQLLNRLRAQGPTAVGDGQIKQGPPVALESAHQTLSKVHEECSVVLNQIESLV